MTNTANDGFFTGIQNYYTQIIDAHGAVPRGVGWRDEASQTIKFDQLLSIIQPSHKDVVLAEIGCGYGALAYYVHDRYPVSEYVGYDICNAMLEQAERLSAHSQCPQPRRFINTPINAPCDYSIASGVFNIDLGPDGKKMSANKWEDYIFSVLDQMNEYSRFGFAFNMQTTYSDFFNEYYYGDPCFFFDQCKKRYSRNVALLHDYELYDFTIHVRKNFL